MKPGKNILALFLLFIFSGNIIFAGFSKSSDTSYTEKAQEKTENETPSESNFFDLTTHHGLDFNYADLLDSSVIFHLHNNLCTHSGHRRIISPPPDGNA